MRWLWGLGEIAIFRLHGDYKYPIITENVKPEADYMKKAVLFVVAVLAGIPCRVSVGGNTL